MDTTGAAFVLTTLIVISAAVYKAKGERTVFAALALFIIGALLTANILNGNNTVYSDKITAEGVVYDISYSESGKQRLDIHTDKINGDKVKIDVRIMADKPYNTEIGDIILADGTAAMPEEAYNPGGFNDKVYMKSKGTVFRLYADSVYYCGRKPMPARNAFYKARETVNVSIDRIYTPEDAALIKAVVTGYKTDISDEQRALYTNGGAVHVLCVSGLHAGVIAALLSFIFVKLLRLKGRMAAAMVTAGLLAYMVFTGNSPSVMRAVIMAVIVLWAKPLGRKSDGLNNIYMSALIILIISPLMLFNSGFLLSFATVYGIVISSKYVSVKGRGIYVKKLLLSSFYATVFSLPITAYCFYSVSLAGAVTNLIILPLTPILVIFGIISAAFGIISVPVGMFFGGTAAAVLKLYDLVLKAASSVSVLNTLTGRPSITACILFYAAVIIITVNVKEKKRLKIAAAVCCILIGFIGTYNGLFGKNIDITYLYVGQGDSTVITDYNGNAFIIDTGGNRFYGENGNTAARYVYPYLQYRGIENIDVLFITHPDTDHAYGSLELMDLCEIDCIVLSDYDFEDSELYDKIISKAELKGIDIKYMSAGDRVVCGDIEFECIYPVEGLGGEGNGGSLALKLKYGEFSAVFTGDLGFDEEKNMMAMGVDLDSDILKLGHHGSSYSSSREFIEEVSPDFAVISAGKNNIYGHPDEETLKRLGDTEYFITYENGAVTVTTDGREYSIKTMR